MNLLQKALVSLARGVKSLSVSFQTAVPWSVLFGGSRYDYGKDADPTKSSIVQACVLWIVRTFPEAPIQVLTQKAGGKEQPILNHPLVQLIERPNPFYSGNVLWMATLADYTISGNAYWLKVRNGQGRPLQLWWLPSSMVAPVGTATEYVTHYTYTINGKETKLAVADVCHFRFGLDPANIRKGLSPLVSILREIWSDEEAANWTASLLKNSGVPPVVLSPEGDGAISAADAELVKADWINKTTGNDRGKPIVIPSALKVQQLAVSPQQMDLRSLRQIPEERVSAVLGVPAIVAGLGAGLARSTFANMSEAREMAYESNIVPTQRLFAADLNVQLLPDFGGRGERVGFDLSKVRVLQEDENKRWMRFGQAFKDGVAMRSEARSSLGLPTTPEDEVYLLPMSAELIGPGAPEPEPVPPALAVAPAPLMLPAPKEDMPPVMPPAKALTFKALDDAGRDRLLGKRDRQMVRQEKRFEKAMTSYFARQGDALVKHAESGSKGLTDGFDWPTWEKMLIDMGLPLIRGIIETSAAEAIAEFGLGVTFDVDNPRVKKWIGERLQLYSSSITDTTKADIAAQLQAGEAAGESIPDLAKRIRGYYDGIGYRAVRTSRTEVLSASNRGAYESYREAGVGRKEWLATHDDRVRPDHLNAHGQIVGIDEPFKVGGFELMHPGDGPASQAILCRCSIAPVMD